MRIKTLRPTRYAAGTAALMLTVAGSLFGLAEYASHLPGTPASATPRPSGTITVRPPFLPAAANPLLRPATAVPASPTAHQVAAALKACDGIRDEFYVPCVTLALRPAATRTNDSGAVISDPPGLRIVTEECRGDSTLSPSELMACLTQPAI